uniref:DUF4070 domain-containing protein n=1 Tax=Prevotellamassilia timonensis TaxID=1852370 RepID=UPI00115F8E88
MARRVFSRNPLLPRTRWPFWSSATTLMVTKRSSMPAAVVGSMLSTHWLEYPSLSGSTAS